MTMAFVQSLCSGSHSCIRIRQPHIKPDRKRNRRCLIKCQSGNVSNSDQEKCGKRKLRMLIAGGGIVGLVLALAAKHRGYDVKVFEKDLTAVTGEGMHRGPIQLVSSALAVLKAIDEHVANQIMETGCVTGNRINGLADGLTGDWFAKLDLLTPALKNGLPITLLISRMTLQDILVNAVGSNILKNKAKVVDFMQEFSKVRVVLENGQHYDGNILIGADGIWSEVRSKLLGKQEASYSGFTCYSELINYVPSYVDTIGWPHARLLWKHRERKQNGYYLAKYRVFLGLNQYFVASDVGNRKMQWYAFHGEPPTTTDFPGKKKRLLNLFRNWCIEVTKLISETPDHMILRRDIYDRDMTYTWVVGRVTLLGDAVHPMRPNLGQGGGMAIEDCYQLIRELDEVAKHGFGFGGSDEVISALSRYEMKRRPRVMTVHTATRMAPKILAYYQPYIHLPLSNLAIKRPLMHVIQALLQSSFPHIVEWMIAGHGLW